MKIRGNNKDTERCAEMIKIRLENLPETLQREQETNELRKKTDAEMNKETVIVNMERDASTNTSQTTKIHQQDQS